MPTATSSSRPGAAAPAAVGPADWPTYQHDNARSGVAPQMSPVGRALGVGWRAELDGAVYGQPLMIGNQVIAATENDSVYALSALDGQVVWSVSLFQPMPGADGWTGRPRIPRSEVPARSLIIGPTPGQNPSASTGAWPHGVQRLGYCSRSMPC